MELTALKVTNFKRSKEIEIVTPALTVVVGGNNSGKSSLLQGIHFAITVLQSARRSADGGKPISTLGFDQFIYKPTGDLIGLNHGSPITSKKGPDFVFTYKDAGGDELKEFSLKLRRGKNANISVTCDEKSTFFSRAADHAHPFSVFVPGLAGVPLREELRTPSVVANGIAQGDSNVYLRNVLYRILKDPIKLTRFHEVIGSIFPGLTITSEFDPDIHLFIDISVELDGTMVPLEMVGTGCLQAIQLVAYVTAYDPSLLLLDEPDAHLHPSNQRLLAATILKITATGKTKIILASHSRHIFDALAQDEQAQVIWLRHGVKQADEDRDALSVLLDLGALDSFELFKAEQQKIVFLTEDTKVARLRILLQANGLTETDYFIQPLHGVNNLAAAVPIADFFTKQADNTWVIIHRDGDCMTQDEKQWWTESETKKLPERTFVFVTPLTDIEHSFCQPEHIAKVYSLSIDDATKKVDSLILTHAAKLTVEYSQKRSHLKDNALRKKDKVPSAVDLIGSAIQFDQVKGKSFLPLLLDSLTADGHNPMHLTTVTSPALVDEKLAALIEKAKQPKEAQGSKATK